VCVCVCMCVHVYVRRSDSGGGAGRRQYRDLPRLLAQVHDGGQPGVNTILSLEETYADVAPVRLNADSVRYIEANPTRAPLRIQYGTSDIYVCVCRCLCVCTWGWV
jgi:hypothetical protein